MHHASFSRLTQQHILGPGKLRLPFLFLFQNSHISHNVQEDEIKFFIMSQGTSGGDVNAA
jgi:hypothetical protein